MDSLISLLITAFAIFLGAAVVAGLLIQAGVIKIPKPARGRDRDRWVCPFCKAVFEKTPQMKSMSREPDATVVVLASQNPRCPGCHAELDGQKMLDGRYDLRLPARR